MFLDLVSSDVRKKWNCGKTKNRGGDTDLVQEAGDLCLMIFHHVDESFNLMAKVCVHNTLGANGLLVCVTIRVDFLLGMLLTWGDS